MDEAYLARQLRDITQEIIRLNCSRLRIIDERNKILAQLRAIHYQLTPKAYARLKTLSARDRTILNSLRELEGPAGNFLTLTAKKVNELEARAGSDGISISPGVIIPPGDLERFNQSVVRYLQEFYRSLSYMEHRLALEVQLDYLIKTRAKDMRLAVKAYFAGLNEEIAANKRAQDEFEKVLTRNEKLVRVGERAIMVYMHGTLIERVSIAIADMESRVKHSDIAITGLTAPLPTGILMGFIAGLAAYTRAELAVTQEARELLNELQGSGLLDEPNLLEQTYSPSLALKVGRNALKIARISPLAVLRRLLRMN